LQPVKNYHALATRYSVDQAAFPAAGDTDDADEDGIVMITGLRPPSGAGKTQ
jgi:hypothetical protein